MGVLKLSILDEQNKQYKAKMKIAAKDLIQPSIRPFWHHPTEIRPF